VGHNLRFGVLGPVLVHRDGAELAAGPPQQQSMLAMLLLAEGRPMSAAKLIDGLWGAHPPGRAIGALRNYVHQLRRILEPDPALPSVLRSVGSGYALNVDFDLVDIGIFEQTVAHADRRRRAGAITEASALLREALSLHRGEPLAGLPGPYAVQHRARLAERRLAVLEDRLELDLAAGRHAEIAAELGALVTAHPLRERLLAQRMTALDRNGQRTAALDAFAAGRRVLLAELDVEPGRELRELHQRILTGTDLPAAGTPVRQHAASRRPAQLPATIADFTGREEIAAAVRTSVLAGAGSAMSVSVLSGLGGVGKTALAVYVANQLTDSFPDGQLYAELHGVDGLPTPPERVLTSFLIALGVAEQVVPDGVDERSALLRSMLAGRKVLLVLDDARDARQVKALLPGTAGCAVLVTSRSKLTSLSGARKFELPVFDEAEALTLLRRIAGPRADDDASAREVVRACGRLPLAVRISASRLVFRPHWSMPLLAERLADQRNRLDELRLSDLAVAGTFQLGYDQLEPQAARAFRLLSVSRPHGFSRNTAAAMLDTSPAEAERLCEDLVEMSLLESTAAGRYRFHDLVRLFARTHALAAESAA
jgi:DNA-binding SARP family transcriptional activator